MNKKIHYFIIEAFTNMCLLLETYIFFYFSISKLLKSLLIELLNNCLTNDRVQFFHSTMRTLITSCVF